MVVGTEWGLELWDMFKHERDVRHIYKQTDKQNRWVIPHKSINQSTINHSEYLGMCESMTYIWVSKPNYCIMIYGRR